MPGPRILLVKLSSLGDVIHLMPAVSDLRQRLPDAHVAWAVEAPYAELVRLHPGVDEAIPVALRALRRTPLKAQAWRDIRAARRALGRGRWDYVVDAQGLIKSACVARWARAPVFGMDKASAREPLAARFYDIRLPVPRGLHAVVRNRRLVGEVFGHGVGPEPRYGLRAPPGPPAWAPPHPYAVLLHAASRAAKRWPEERWVALGRELAARGYTPVFPGGSAEERAAGARLAAGVGAGAIAAPAMALTEAAALIGHAAGVVGVDTGLTHLAVALGVPTVGIYCATLPGLTGLHGANAVNLGGPRAAPDVASVLAATLGAPEAAAVDTDAA
jgi:lipopolysaccharide heptosyltransferase I